MVKRITKALAETSSQKPQKEKPAVKLPKSLAMCADLLYTTQQQRFALNKEAEKLQAIEVALRQHLIDTLPKGEASGTNPNTKPPRPSAPAVSGDVNHDGVVNEADLEACCPEGANADCLLECLPPPPAQEENPDDVVGDDVDLEGCLNACAEDDRDCLLECLGQPPQAGN